MFIHVVLTTPVLQIVDAMAPTSRLLVIEVVIVPAISQSRSPAPLPEVLPSLHSTFFPS